MEEQHEETWDRFVEDFQSLHRALAGTQAHSINSTELRANARACVQSYFRATRPGLKILGVDGDLLSSLDQGLVGVLKLSHKQSAKSSYMSLLDNLQVTVEAVMVEREYRYSEQAFLEASPAGVELLDHENLIYELLSDLVPSAARSYRQGIIDLSDENRISYRGAANEFRETLRELLDHLAPDKDVMSEDGFKLVKDQTQPTRRQKAKYILNARGTSKSAMKVPVDFIESIEDKVAAIVSATYSRTNVAAHIQMERNEVLSIKRFLDAVLAELLSLPLSREGFPK